MVQAERSKRARRPMTAVLAVVVAVTGLLVAVEAPGGSEVVTATLTPVADTYVDGTDDQPRALCAVDLAAPTTRVSTWRMPVAGEDRRGVWAQRYYLPGTKWSDG